MDKNFLVIGIMFFVAYIFQFIFTLLQTKNITNTYLMLSKKYKGNYYIGMNKRKKIGLNSIVIIVVDHSMVIKELHAMKGIFVTSRMKPIIVKGEIKINELSNEKEILEKKLGKKVYMALQNAAENILDCV
ncbi:transcriptional regulator [Faecalicoccus pleomorphus]|uniref:transcriptional regulator GutM n=1 Tax=Faecalicoccus TaxID=1573536 RepID=UPI001431269C|nr:MULTISPECIES: transcriptional regulator GutM [Faecalicoccus]MCI6380782.1 transcriptional regulator GutM [Erysipelotrichaceae bacterium]MDB7987047.1 transcriptional regulator GutM [Faecalicoccus pleomorphus]MDB7991731.1 transcriptional regulator GutM [Faecalicoccus pleomorphus]MDY4278766.1 transcriptional regulator GutM [Faecalicoccus sp.]MDY4870154.1 transcriptional regulator GutM [Faecalicoccus sp.]